MERHKLNVKYPDLKGSEQHHDLKDNPGEHGNSDHASKDGDWEKLTDEEAAKLKSKLSAQK